MILFVKKVDLPCNKEELHLPSFTSPVSTQIFEALGPQ